MRPIRTLLLLALPALLAAPALPDSLELREVPAGARWLVHIDVEAILASKTYRLLEARQEQLDMDLEDIWNEAHEELNIDLREDLDSVTVFGTTSDHETAVAILDANSNVDRLEDRLRELDHYEPQVIGGYRLHTNGGDKRGDSVFAYVHRPKDLPERRVVLISNDADRLLEVIRLHESQGRSLAEARFDELRAKPRPGSFFYGAAADGIAELADIEPASAVARMARSLEFDIGEVKGEIFVHARLETERIEDARNIVQVLQGGTAMIQLAAGNSDGAIPFPVQDLLGALSFQTDNTTVMVDFRYEVERLFEDLQAIEERTY